jgi:hypothetical protein
MIGGPITYGPTHDLSDDDYLDWRLLSFDWWYINKLGEAPGTGFSRFLLPEIGYGYQMITRCVYLGTRVWDHLFLERFSQWLIAAS